MEFTSVIGFAFIVFCVLWTAACGVAALGYCVWKTGTRSVQLMELGERKEARQEKSLKRGLATGNVSMNQAQGALRAAK